MREYSARRPSSRRSLPLKATRLLKSSVIIAAAALLTFLLGEGLTFARPDEAAPPALAPVERELKGGESHAYSISLAAGHFLHALVEQKGIDVEVILSGPDGRQLSVADSPNDLWGPEPITLIAEAAGVYRVVGRASNAAGKR